MSTLKSKRSRRGRLTSSGLVFGALFLAVGLTALSDSQAQALSHPAASLGRSATANGISELRVLDWSLWYVAKYYVEPRRIDPRKMTMAALEGLEEAIPEVLVEPDGKRMVKVRVGTSEQSFAIHDVEALWAVGNRVREVFHFVRDHTQLTDDQLRDAEYAIVEGVLGTLDPHTTLMRPEAYESMQMGVRGRFGGLGIEVGMRD
ncbi:MAG: hypothetical protein KC636_13600, partial [Myxococcales bacterium]|nr:hypothetical protein [Myxococcales bacterium]